MKRYLFLFLVFFGLILATSVQASSTEILNQILTALKTSFNGFEGDFGGIDLNLDTFLDDISRVWNQYLREPVMKFLGGVINYLKQQWAYRKGIFHDEWLKEKQELWDSFKDLWSKI